MKTYTVTQNGGYQVRDLLKAIKRAIEVIDTHISENPTAITQLPELRNYLANCVDRCVHYLNLTIF